MDEGMACGTRVRRQPRNLDVGTITRVDLCAGISGRSYMLFYVRWDDGRMTRELYEDIAPLSDGDQLHGWR